MSKYPDWPIIIMLILFVFLSVYELSIILDLREKTTYTPCPEVTCRPVECICHGESEDGLQSILPDPGTKYPSAVAPPKTMAMRGDRYHGI